MIVIINKADLESIQEKLFHNPNGVVLEVDTKECPICGFKEDLQACACTSSPTVGEQLSFEFEKAERLEDLKAKIKELEAQLLETEAKIRRLS
jgi:hypothetical protein